MKKLLSIIGCAIALSACNDAGSKFIGTWSNADTCSNAPKNQSCSYDILEISKNDGGTSYNIKSIVHYNAYEVRDFDGSKLVYSNDYKARDHLSGNFPATLDGDTLIIDFGIAKTSIRINNNKLEFGKRTLNKVN